MTENPFNADAEIAVLSIILKNSTEKLEYNGLRSFMFSSIVNQTLFSTIESFRERDLNPDIGLLINSLEADGCLDKIGGKEYLSILINKYDFDKKNFSEYVRTVCNYFKTRAVLNIASNIKPDTIKAGDIDDTLMGIRKQLDDLHLASTSATTIHINEQLKEAYEAIMSRRDSPGLRGSSWGIKEIDEATAGKVGGELWIVGGRPSSGKSALLINSVLADARSGNPVLFFSREMNYQSLVERMLAIETGVPIVNIRQGILTQEQVNLIFNKLTEFKSLPIFIDVNFSTTNVHYLESTINKYKRLHGIKVVYVDYIQLLAERDEGQTAELGRFSKMFKTVCNNLDICAVVASQLNRQVEMRENKRPILSDLRQSGNLEEDADFVVGLYRDEYYNKETKYKDAMEFIILKARNAAVGTVTIKFEGETNRIGKM